jgi:hypothetical protein
MVVIDPIFENGELIGFAKITRDMTEERNAQLQLDESREQLLQLQKMEAVRQLTGDLAHDFRVTSELLIVAAIHANRWEEKWRSVA